MDFPRLIFAQHEARIRLMTPPADVVAMRSRRRPGEPLRIRIYTPGQVMGRVFSPVVDKPGAKSHQSGRRGEHQCAHLNAFPRWSLWRHRVFERGVSLHLREIIPAVPRVIFDSRGLAPDM